MEAGANVVVNPDIKVSLNEEKTRMTIDIPLEPRPRPSRKGGTFVVASTHGLLDTGIEHKDSKILLQVNAFIDFTL